MPAQEFTVPYPARGSVLGAPELSALAELVGSSRTLSAGGCRAAFEQRFAKLVGSRHAVSTTSGTVALELAVKLLDLEVGDEVIATPQTYRATLDPLLDQPITVRFCDIDPLTLNAEPGSVESLVSGRTRAILLVHYGGLPADMDSIMRLARRHGITVIEDCAHALGSSYYGRRPGSLANLSCFSFHTSKNITTLGEGGMVTTDDDTWAERLERLRSNASDAEFRPRKQRIGDRAFASAWMLHPGNAYTHACTRLRHHGTNATLSEAAAAVGIVQLDRLDTLTAARRGIAERIGAVLRRFPFAVVPQEPEGVVSSHHLYTFSFKEGCGIDRDRFVEGMIARGVELQLRYFPLHLLPEWQARGHREGECPNAERMWFDRQVNLPCHPSLSDRQVTYLANSLEAQLVEAAAGRWAVV